MVPHDAPSTVTLLRPRFIQGYVALFDVLGFRSLCQSNSEESTLIKAMRYIDGFPEGMRYLLVWSLAGGKSESISAAEKHVQAIQYRVFSDTLLMVLPIDSTTSELLTFLSHSAIINRRLFELGLPLRGTLHKGRILLGNRCAMGRVLIEAMDIYNNVKAACTVVTEGVWMDLQERFKDEPKKREMASWIITKPIVPTEDMGVKLRTLNWFNVSIGYRDDPSDVESFVLEAFKAHGKSISSDDVRLKVRNTVEIFRIWLSHRAVKRKRKKGLRSKLNQHARKS